MATSEVVDTIVGTVKEYGSLADRQSRVTQRALVLKLLEKLQLAPAKLKVRSVSEEELLTDPVLRGGTILHLDLTARSPLTTSELVFTAASGKVLVAEHPDMRGFPVGISLLLPANDLPLGRRMLYTSKSAGWGASPVVVQYAIATNPGGLGAGRALVEASLEAADDARFIAYAPLTGLRARIMRVVDDERLWQRVVEELGEKESQKLLRQLTDLLARDTLPDLVGEPARSLLQSEAAVFAGSSAYRVGEFHRHLGATCIGVDCGGDPSESDSMWTRAYLAYPPKA